VRAAKHKPKSQWTANDRIRGFLERHFGITMVPCYYWLLCLLKLVKPDSMNRCMARWAQALMPDGAPGVAPCADLP